MGLGIEESLALLLGWANVGAVAVTLLIALYWVIRKAVAAEIRDARSEADPEVD